jgi:ribosomal protein S12 methylthiotransferase accessory factor
LTWLNKATLANQPYMAPDPAQPARCFTDYPQQHSGDFLQDIAFCRHIIEEQGMEMLTLLSFCSTPASKIPLIGS